MTTMRIDTGISQGSVIVTLNADGDKVLLTVSDDDSQTKIAMLPQQAMNAAKLLVAVANKSKPTEGTNQHVHQPPGA